MKSCVCVKCLSFGKTEYHHIYPVRNFGKNDKTILLCARCHAEIERILPAEKMTGEQYREIHKKWLSGINVLVVWRSRREHYRSN
jgi:hypothetical protein